MGIALKANMITAMILVGFAFGGQPLIGYSYGAGAKMLRFQQLGMTFMAVTLVSICVCQSVGNALGAFTLSISRQGVIYVIVLFLLSRIFGYTGVLASQACADVATAAIAVCIICKILKQA